MSIRLMARLKTTKHIDDLPQTGSKGKHYSHNTKHKDFRYDLINPNLPSPRTRSIHVAFDGYIKSTTRKASRLRGYCRCCWQGGNDWYKTKQSYFKSIWKVHCLYRCGRSCV